MRSKSKPSESGWPLDLRYATGITLVEIERILPNQTYASIELFKSPEFGKRMQAAMRELHEETGSPPGLVSPGHPLLDDFKRLTPTGSIDDPLLRTYRVNFLNSWRPRLREDDFIQIYYSTWDTVNPSTSALSGHGPQDVHFYFALCWHFPEEMAEQLLQLVRLNPEGQTWGQLAARKEFERALEVSTKARCVDVSRATCCTLSLNLSSLQREDILSRFMARCGVREKLWCVRLTSDAPLFSHRVALEPKRSVKQRFVHTTTDILVPGAKSYFLRPI
jgi:8-oxo-dGTP pyrophosphatase MutT (NUDIX family)